MGYRCKMSYVLIKNNTAKKYPYSIYDLKKDNPNTSFPDVLSQGQLRELGIFKVVREEKERSHLKNYSYGEVVFIDGQWVEPLIESDASESEISQRIDEKWSEIRSNRDNLLKSSDWTQLPDVALSAEAQRDWAVYRQKLRDITEQTDPFEIWFPEEPSNG